MATGQLIGTLGGGKITESKFNFRLNSLSPQYIENLWSVPRGDYLFAWQGELKSDSGRTGTVVISGTSFPITSSPKTTLTGGWAILRNVTEITASGTGVMSFLVDPLVAFVRIS